MPVGSFVSLAGLLDNLTDGFLIPFPLMRQLSPDGRFHFLWCRVAHLIDLFIPVSAVPVAGLLIPFPLPWRSSSECLYHSLCCRACCQIAYFVCLVPHANGFLIPFPFPLHGLPHRIICFPCPTCHWITYSFSLPATLVTGLLIPIYLLPCRAADCLSSFSFTATRLDGLLVRFTFTPRHSVDRTFRFPCAICFQIPFLSVYRCAACRIVCFGLFADGL